MVLLGVGQGENEKVAKTTLKVQQQFHWPGMHDDIALYCKTCVSCKRNKPSNRRAPGLLQPLDITFRPWDTISIDFITHLPKTIDGYDCIMVVVDKFSKRAHFIPTTSEATAEDTAQLLYKVSSVTVTNGGSGYSSINLPTLAFSSPGPGATSVTATANAVVPVSSSTITAVTITNQGAGYTSVPTLTVSQGFGGSGAEFTVVMEVTGSRDAISVFKTFTVKVIRAYNYPYQNLYVLAMPPANDRLLIDELLFES